MQFCIHLSDGFGRTSCDNAPLAEGAHVIREWATQLHELIVHYNQCLEAHI